MKNPKKVIALVIGIVVILAVGGWLYFQFNTSVFPPNPVERDWKTYKNDTYGFEVKYPQILTVSENQKTGVEIFGVSFENSLANRQTSGRKVVFNVSIFGNSNQLQDAYKSLNLQDQGEIVIGGYTAKKLYRPTGPDYTTVYLIADKNLSIMSTDTNYNEISKTDIDLILSTFKFIKSSNTITDVTKDWKTYSNNEYGFEFGFPKDLSLVQPDKTDKLYNKNFDFYKYDSDNKYEPSYAIHLWVLTGYPVNNISIQESVNSLFKMQKSATANLIASDKKIGITTGSSLGKESQETHGNISGLMLKDASFSTYSTDDYFVAADEKKGIIFTFELNVPRKHQDLTEEAVRNFYLILDSFKSN